MKNYLVKLTLIIGDFEKSSSIVVQAVNEKKAGTLALVMECHDKPDWTNNNKNECWDCGQMIYRVYSIQELNDIEFETLKKLGLAY